MSQWRPSASIPQLKARAQLMQLIRHYFNQEQVWEVETPILSAYATVDPHIESFSTEFLPPSINKSDEKQKFYLRTSPEFAMKRLLAAGSGDIYSLGPVFRNGEYGRHHNPEFTLLEWYRINQNLDNIMSDVTRLLMSLSNFIEIKRMSYAEAFSHHLSINPHGALTDEIKRLTRQKSCIDTTELTRNDCLELLFSQYIQPFLGKSTSKSLKGYYIYNYPKSMADLATITYCPKEKQLVAKRFELFINGVELANGYYELLDSAEQKHRFLSAQETRGAAGQYNYPFDEHLIAALNDGMPACSGVALGLERLLMLITETTDIASVMAFEFVRA